MLFSFLTRGLFVLAALGWYWCRTSKVFPFCWKGSDEAVCYSGVSASNCISSIFHVCLTHGILDYRPEEEAMAMRIAVFCPRWHLVLRHLQIVSNLRCDDFTSKDSTKVSEMKESLFGGIIQLPLALKGYFLHFVLKN